MKKFILIAGILFLFSSQSEAQRAFNLGMRAGSSTGFTAKLNLDEHSALEAIAAFRWNGFIGTALYEYHLPIGEVPRFRWYWGFGGHVGVWNRGPFTTGVPIVGAGAVFGVDYSFEFPLNLSADVIPSFNFIGDVGPFIQRGGVAARYMF